MEPLSIRTFKIIIVIGVVALIGCATVAVVAGDEINYTSKTLEKYVPEEGDLLNYQVTEGENSYILQVQIKEIDYDMVNCALFKVVGETITHIGDRWLTSGLFTGDVDALTGDVEVDDSKVEKHTSPFGSLTCRTYECSGAVKYFKDVLSNEYGDKDSEDSQIWVDLQFWVYSAHLTDYHLTVYIDETKTTLNIALINFSHQK